MMCIWMIMSRAVHALEMDMTFMNDFMEPMYIPLGMKGRNGQQGNRFPSALFHPKYYVQRRNKRCNSAVQETLARGWEIPDFKRRNSLE